MVLCVHHYTCVLMKHVVLPFVLSILNYIIILKLIKFHCVLICEDDLL